VVWIPPLRAPEGISCSTSDPRLQRARPGRGVLMTAPLTARDQAILTSLSEFRYLRVNQVQRLHFPSAQTTLRRLRILERGGFVRPFRAVGIPDRIATLCRGGMQLIARDSDGPRPATSCVRRELPIAELFLRHFLAIVDFRIALMQSCQSRPDVGLLSF